MLLDHTFIARSTNHANVFRTIFQINSFFIFFNEWLFKAIIQIVDVFAISNLFVKQIYKAKSHFDFYSDDG